MSATTDKDRPKAALRAVGIVRVSVVGGREEGHDFASPEVQRQRLRDLAAREGLDLVGVHEEMDVSGAKPLAERAGLSAAVEAVEAGRASVVMVAYLDRLARSYATQAEVVPASRRPEGTCWPPTWARSWATTAPPHSGSRGRCCPPWASTSAGPRRNARRTA